MLEARHLFQREEEPSVGIRAWGKALVSKRIKAECWNTFMGPKAFVSNRRTAKCWNTCMGQGICFKEKNSRVLEYVQGERHLFHREEQPNVGKRGKAFV